MPKTIAVRQESTEAPERRSWTRWFAWHPIRTVVHRRVFWLTWVERRCLAVNPRGGCYAWQYRRKRRRSGMQDLERLRHLDDIVQAIYDRDGKIDPGIMYVRVTEAIDEFGLESAADEIRSRP